MIRAIDIAARGNRWAGRHPAEKMVLYLGGLAIVMAAPRAHLPAAGIGVGIVAVIASLCLARVPTRLYLGLVAVPTGFLLTSVATLAVSLDWSDGWRLALAPDAWATIWPPCVRVLATLACLIGLATTTPVSDLLAFLGRVGVPAFLTDLALMIYRQIWVTAEIVERSIAAQRARLGFGGYRGTLRSLGIVAATLFPRLLARSHRLELGLAARNFGGRLAFLESGAAASPARIAVTGLVLAATALAAALLPVAP
ncbi:cobalt/nickel transport system permease protein [Dongia mobilis]|uniref:Cobalt/nickel transport system permease protein n=1 Tax=Dongia mobilis TaxID=578943 RepID=A0A4R6WNJ5_9PROT|nr:cobalt ECF transporter T component CbiQ [Dongia mobilis]TDQ80464.1 cobalt/nickel transport system permease protein [Dongia mobilis]